jgi:hypothetical protein
LGWSKRRKKNWEKEREQIKQEMQHFDVFAFDVEPYAARPVVNQIVFLNTRALEIFKKAIIEESEEKERLQAMSKETLIQYIPELKTLIIGSREGVCRSVEYFAKDKQTLIEAEKIILLKLETFAKTTFGGLISQHFDKDNNILEISFDALASLRDLCKKIR